MNQTPQGEGKKEVKKLVIVIDGDSYDELFAVGPDDLMDLLVEKLYVKREDIKKCWFEKRVGDILKDEEVTVYKHKDNHYGN